MAFAQHLNLQAGQRIQVRVEELQDWGSLIVHYQGNLFRVMNTSGRVVSIGEILDLQVTSTNPVELRFYKRSAQFERVV